MDAEQITAIAIQATREILMKALDSPFTLAVMTVEQMDPEEVEDQVERILEYLEKTRRKEDQNHG